MRFLLTIILLFLATRGQAQELYQGYRNARSLGMGGVGISIVNNAEAVFINPAALGKIEGIDIHALGLNVGAREPSKEDFDAIEGIDANDPSTFNDLFGRRIYAQLMGSLAVATPYFGFGYYTDYDISLQLRNPGFPQFETYFRNDQAYVVAAAYPLGPKSYFGFSMKRINRWGGETKEIGLTSIADGGGINSIMNEFKDKGTGYGIDVALLHIVDGPLSPTVTMVLQNAGSTAFTKTEGDNAPTRIPQDLSAGVSMGFDLPGLAWTVALEGRHLLDSEIQIGKKAHLGTEISLAFLDIRAGFNQGYLSYGVGADFFIFRVDAVSYKEELGVYPGQTADNRLMVGLSIDLSFDANFNFTDNGVKKRKLKQRR